MFEGVSRQEEHDITLPSGEKLKVTGVARGPLENPTITGADSDGNKVEVAYETIDDALVVVSYTINGEEQLQNKQEAA